MYRVILAIVTALCIGAGVYLLMARNTDPTAWKTYQNKELGFSFDYPPTFNVEENRNADGGSVSVRAGYVYIYIWLKPSAMSEVSQYFTGPYPKVIPATGNNSEQAVVERDLNGMRGVEYYGFGGEGTSFDDVFLYKNRYLWSISLDPVMEGRQTQEREPGAPVPNKAIYDRMISSIRISS
jgi:hypothetical protein